MSIIEEKVISKWQSPFRNEKDVTNRFLGYIDELSKFTELNEPNINREIEKLKYAKTKYEEWLIKPHDGSNIFLSPAVERADKIAQILLENNFPNQAFWVCNIFSEICKILVERRREKYQPLFENLLITACYSVSDSWRRDKTIQVVGIEGGEISKLSNSLENIIIQSALSQYFNNRYGDFARRQRPETAIGERLINNTLARHFDYRLRELLEHDRPRVQEYVRVNMPYVFRINLSKKASEKRNEWEHLISEAGYDDTIQLLKDMGDLINPDEVGQISSERREEVIRAATDLGRVNSLLSESAKELKSYLYREAQERLHYKEPNSPKLGGGQSSKFFQAAKLTRTDDPDQVRRALPIMRDLWQQDISNLDLKNWVAYLQAKTGNLPAAQQMFEEIQKRRLPKHNFATDWNLAVLAYDRKNESEAYGLLMPLLDGENLDEDLIIVVLALSLKLDDQERFLNTVPLTMTLKYHPLALDVAYQIKNTDKAEELLAQLLNQWQGKWQLPPYTQRFDDNNEFVQTINRAIVERQTEQVIAWLEARSRHNGNWIPNYLQLSRVLEEEVQDIDKAFEVLRRRCEQIKRKKNRDQRSIDEAYRDMLELCKRAKRNDLGGKAYQLAKKSFASDDLLNSFGKFNQDDKRQETGENETILQEKPITKNPSIISRDPGLTENLAWTNARLTSIGNVSTYVSQSQAIDKFSKIVVEVSPQESATIIDIVQGASAVIETFSGTKIEELDARRVLYERANNYEKRLYELLRSKALTTHLTDVVTPYAQALKRVIGDLSRQVGESPSIDAAIENSFISLENNHTTLAVLVTNQSQRAVRDVLIQLLPENPLVTVSGNRERRLDSLDVQKSHIFNFPIERNSLDNLDYPQEISFGISLEASAEGFSKIQGIKKQTIPIKKLQDVIGIDRIPKLFQAGQPLNPADPTLFQGRNDVLSQIQGSFYGGIQREKYFLDGIRRVGKTSILNFLTLYLPENIIPVLVNMQNLGIRGPINSAVVLRGICALIRDELIAVVGNIIEPLPESAFESAPGAAFAAFLNEVETTLPGRVPLLLIDEFQELLEAIAKTGTERNRDKIVLDQMRSHLEGRKLSALFTGSVRFDRLSRIIDHHIFGTLRRLRVSFLSEGEVSDVLRAGLEKWVTVPSETIKKIYQLTGGYPWLIQTYGSESVDLLNRERRTIITPEDIIEITNKSVICNNELFRFWWAPEQLKLEEERFIERLLRNYQSNQPVSIEEFFADIHSNQRAEFTRALENLRACEVLDSTQNKVLMFSGDVLREWLQQQLQDGKLKIQSSTPELPVKRGRVGVFVDHENLIKGLERISNRRGISVPTDKIEWFSSIFEHIYAEIERRVGKINHHKVTVAFWSRPHEAILLSPYFSKGFRPSQPEALKEKNAADLKLADEFRQEREKAINEGSSLDQVIIVGADSDLVETVKGLKINGVDVKVWGGSKDVKDTYIDSISEENFVALDDVCGL